MKKYLVALLVVIAIAIVGQAQTIKLSATFTGSDYSFDTLAPVGPVTVNDNNQGLGIEADVKVLKSNNFRIGGVLRYERTCFDCYPKVDVYSLGPQVSYDVFKGRVSLF